jgi:excisionase family DNA binding protein
MAPVTTPTRLDMWRCGMTSNVITSGKAYLSIYEAATIVQLSVVTLRRAIKARRLAVCKPNGKFGKILIRPQDLTQYVEGNRHMAISEYGGHVR